MAALNICEDVPRPKVKLEAERWKEFIPKHVEKTLKEIGNP